MLSSTTAAGTISQIARGFSSFFTRSRQRRQRPDAPFLDQLLHRFRRLGRRPRSAWPPAWSRRTMFAPIRPSPIIPSCILTELRCCSRPISGVDLITRP